MPDFVISILLIFSIVLVFSLWGMWCEHKEKKEWREADAWHRRKEGFR